MSETTSKPNVKKAHLKFNMFMRRITAIRGIIITAITTKAMIIHSFYIWNRQTIEFTELFLHRTYVVCIPYEQRNNKLQTILSHFRFVAQLMVWFIAHLQPLFVHVGGNGTVFAFKWWKKCPSMPRLICIRSKNSRYARQNNVNFESFYLWRRYPFSWLLAHTCIMQIVSVHSLLLHHRILKKFQTLINYNFGLALALTLNLAAIHFGIYSLLDDVLFYFEIEYYVIEFHIQTAESR